MNDTKKWITGNVWIHDSMTTPHARQQRESCKTRGLCIVAVLPLRQKVHISLETFKRFGFVKVELSRARSMLE